ncbi:MAG: UvrD-helicase domain-containing protein [Acholeplasmatales bacterium]|nr:UvrD-helicase domain-containing protein [Acholeplasmatales bacterium]
MNKPTPDQQKIIDAGVENMLVSAGAGCGKSSVLTARIIKRIKEGKLSIKNLIVLSFTNASANDIRKKIKEALKTELDNNPKLIDEYDFVEQSNISTFDSLCHNFFKQYSYKLGLKSDINILDGTQYSYILSGIINDVCEKYYDNPTYIKLLDLLTIRDDTSFKESLFNFYNSHVNNSVDSIEFLNNLMNVSKSNIDKLLNDYKNKKDEIINRIKMAYMEADIDEDADIIFRSFINPILLANNWADLENFRLDISTLPGRNRKPFAGKNNPNGDFHLVFKPLLIEYLNYNDSVKSILDSLNDMLKYSDIIKDICIDIFNKYNEYCYQNNAFTFNDVAKMVIKLLKENSDVLENIKSKITEIYVDEYQDTSNIQEELINLISTNNLIVVGDVKQSIYRFRNANPNIFKKKFDEYGKNIGGTRVDLKDNFRSRVEVLNEINNIFDLLMTSDFDGINYKDEHRLNPGNKKFTDIEPGIEFYHVNAKEMVDDKSKPRPKIDVVEENFERVLRDIEYKKREKGLKYSDFAVIVRNKGYFNNYSKIAEKYNIPLVCEASKPFIRNTEIMVLNSIINYLCSKEDIYKVSILRSFLFNVSDQEILNYLNGNTSDNIKEIDEKLLDICLLKDYVSLYELIKEIYDKFEFFKHIYKLDDPIGAEKRLLYMLNNSNTYMALGWTYREMNEYLNVLNTPSLRKELDISYDSNDAFNDDAVNLITIHKSKGLEYKYIYFVELDSVVGKIDKNPIAYHDDIGLSIKSIYGDNFINQKMDEVNKLEQIYEDLRLLYVCLTRAKCGIVIFTASDKFGDETKLVDYVNKDDKAEFKTYDDMLMSAFESYKALDDKEIVFNKRVDDFKEKNVIFDDLKIDSSLYNFERASHNIENLIDRETALSLKYGTKLHKILEDLDFNNPDYSGLDDNVKNKVKLFIDNLDVICKEKPIRFYKEYDIKMNDTNGQIDLLVETDNFFIVIDYKSKEINKDYYKTQVKSYMNEISKKTDKNVLGFLYSISDGIYKEIL